MRVAVNGLGRIGKLVVRQLLEHPGDIELVLLNDKMGNPEQHALLLNVDTVHGPFAPEIGFDDQAVYYEGRRIPLTQASDIEGLSLKDHAVDMVIDCTGTFKTVKKVAPYYDHGVRKVLVSAPVKEEGACNLVYGINHNLYDANNHHLITAASCTTNCLAPVVEVIHKELDIKHGMITTIHNVTNTQTILDRPSKDMRRARSALNAMIPTTTGSATAITVIYPELKGKLNGHAVRVPLVNGSLTDCVFEVSRKTDVEEVNGLLDHYAQHALQGILGFERRPLVSADFVNDTRSSIIDGPSTMVVDDTQVKIYAWYDNEMGYACRMVDIARMIVAQA